MTTLDKCEGVIFGLAIGDALGWPTEFIRLEQIKSQYGEHGIEDLPDPALYTDDTQMSLAVAEALIESGKDDLDTVMASIRKYFILWYHSPENNRAPGPTCLRGVENLEAGTGWRNSGNSDSKGCGSAMRVAPIGFLYQDQPEKLRQVAKASGICTHGHPTAIAASIGAAYLVKAALDGMDPEHMIEGLLGFTSGISEEWEAAIGKVQECLDWEEEEDALRYLGEGWVGEEAVALALYCFLRSPEDYSNVVLRAANTNGDSDSIACIAGSISGAYLGANAIPRDWKDRIEKKEYLTSIANGLNDLQRSL
ncbi:MAG: ADP-ribosylglycohydrolase family protein [Chloroflexi bacterium]|jgi:ADP-ribosylglycohydrolase|nr:ADP-ribosylglycohydrolase family protein [Chloroflexota bacterium]